MVTMFTTALVGFFVFSSFGMPPQTIGQSPPVPTYTVAMTGYNAVPEQTDSDPRTTASGAFSDPDIVAARSVDLADELPFGTVIEIVPKSSSPSCGLPVVKDMLGLRVIADSMHPRKRNQIDVLLDREKTVHIGNKTINPAIALGMCQDVEVHVVGFIDIAHVPHTQAELRAALSPSTLALEK